MNKEENTLTIETYISWKNIRFALSDFIKEALKELEDDKNKIDKAINYIDRMTRGIDYNDDEFITWEHIIEIENILRGEDNER